MKMGNFDLHLISDGSFWLDGGAMFGVVPRKLWQRQCPPDEFNRIKLGLNCLLVRSEENNVLIDTGCGFKYSEKEISIYGIEHETNILEQLRLLNLSPEDINIVINTHLHFDHCGGNTFCRKGHVHPTFPKAKYFVQRKEYEDATQANERTRGSYFEHNWCVLLDKGQLELIDGTCEIIPGITCLATPGHTRGHQAVRIKSGTQNVFFPADLCPTTAHVPLPWIMAYDLFPLTTLETRRSLYAQAESENWFVVFEHDPRYPCGHLKKTERGWLAEPIDWADRSIPHDTPE